MDRRTFLSIVAGSPLVFGLREIMAQEVTSDFVDAAFKRMKETRRYGVFLVIPSTEAAQKRLGQGLLSRLPTGSKAGGEGFELFCATVFVCLTDVRAARAVIGAKVDGPGLLRMLLDPQGNLVAADRVPLEVFEDAAPFRESFTKFIHGADGARLRDLAKAIEADMSDEIKSAAAKVGVDPSKAWAAMKLLKSKADTIAPWLVQKEIEKEGAGYRRILWEYYLEQAARDPEPALPFGLRVERVAVEDPCPPCGMAAYRPSAYRFLSFYAK